MADQSIVELQARWDKIRVANVFDTLDSMGYTNQCLDLGIRPLFPHQHLAGMAITVRGSAYPVPRGEDANGWTGNYFEELRKLLYPGCVVVVECGGEPYAGKFGEMTSWALKQGGAHGIVLDSFIRDSWGLEVIPNYTACARGTSPIESASRWRMTASRVRVDPGDWIIAEADGVMVVPKAIAMEALVKAEKLEAEEEGMRQDVAKGMSFDDAYKKWGRA
jgi:4-hydroxy-4-methyl-2-oxoglutarate aldolase